LPHIFCLHTPLPHTHPHSFPTRRSSVLDYTTAGFDGVEALDLVRQHDADMPFLFVSNVRGEDAAVAAMRTGAHDYILKANLQRRSEEPTSELLSRLDLVCRLLLEKKKNN